MKKSPWRFLRDHPPALCRLLARRKVSTKKIVALTNQEIAIGGGLPLARVAAIAGQVTWNGVTLDEVERFVAGCQFDPLSFQDRNRKSAYERSCQKTKVKWKYLRESPVFETELKPLIARLKSRHTS